MLGHLVRALHCSDKIYIQVKKKKNLGQECFFHHKTQNRAGGKEQPLSNNYIRFSETETINNQAHAKLELYRHFFPLKIKKNSATDEYAFVLPLTNTYFLILITYF